MDLVRYEPGVMSADDLESAAKQAWTELRSDDAALQRLDPDTRQLVMSTGEIDLEVVQEGSGLDPISTAILVKIVIPLAGAIAIDLWKTLILPRIRARWGADALGPERE